MTRAALWTPGDTPQEGAKATGLYLPGVSGNNVSFPSASIPHMVDLDLRIKVSGFSLPTVGVDLISRYQAASSQVAFSFFIDSSSRLAFGWSEDGITQVTNTSVIALDPGVVEGKWFRVVFDADNGAGQSVGGFYLSDDGETWVSFGTEFARSALSIKDTIPPYTLGGSGRGGYRPVVIHAAELRNGIDGPIVAQWDGSVPHERQVDPQGNVWTVNGTANAWQEV